MQTRFSFPIIFFCGRDEAKTQKKPGAIAAPGSLALVVWCYNAAKFTLVPSALYSRPL